MGYLDKQPREKKYLKKNDNKIFQYSMVTRYNYSKLVQLNQEYYINNYLIFVKFKKIELLCRNI